MVSSDGYEHALRVLSSPSTSCCCFFMPSVRFWVLLAHFLALASSQNSLSPADNSGDALVPSCPVKNLVVSRVLRHGESPQQIKGTLTAKQVAAHLGKYTGLTHITIMDKNHVAAQLETLERVSWQSSQQHYFSSWDGRGNYELLGTAGGDIAEFINAARVLEQMPEYREFTDQRMIDTLFSSYLATRQRFYVQNDEFNVRKWAKAANVTDPLHPQTEDERARVLRFAPRFCGCDHLHAMMVQEEQYGSRRLLVEMVIRSVVDLYTDPATPTEIKQKILYVTLKGYPHEEEAFVDILSPAYDPKTPSTFPAIGCAFKAPMVEPASDSGHSIIVYHARAVYEYRAALAKWFAHHERKDPQWRLSFFKELVALGDRGVKLSKAMIAKHLPTFLASYQL